MIKQVEERLGKRFAIRHCANTGSVARYPETYLDMVRPGLLLYGYGEFAEELNLKPVMSLKAAVSKRVPRIYYRNGQVIEKELLLRG